ncbi:MAG TPA: response regulator transcription factor [Alphaproteobacteria bacterium]|jgi:two-component system nitrate/nitrite response regulator NarL
MTEANGAKPRTSTLIIEGNRLFREGLKYLLAGSQFEIRLEADSFESANDSIREGFLPELIVLDFQDDDGLAVENIRHLRGNLRHARIVVLTYSLSAKKLAKALEAGADSYLLSDMSPEALIQSLALTMLGEKVFPTNLAKLLIDGRIDFANGDRPFSSGTLSEREIQILRCLANGDPNKMIANRLNITEATVKVHLKGLLRKINVCNRTQAAIWAVGQGIDKSMAK